MQSVALSLLQRIARRPLLVSLPMPLLPQLLPLVQQCCAWLALQAGSLLHPPMPHSVCFKGGEGEEAVLCTADKTFAVKSVETTNLVLLMQGAQKDFRA